MLRTLNPATSMSKTDDAITNEQPANAGCAAVTGYALTETQARSLHDNLRLHEERIRNWARSAKTIDEYDCPCRLASALSDAMEAISDMIMKGQCVHSTELRSGHE
jgi:hypothetical protein